MREIELGNGKVVAAKEQPQLADDDVGAVTWDAGLVLAYYMVHAADDVESQGELSPQMFASDQQMLRLISRLWERKYPAQSELV